MVRVMDDATLLRYAWSIVTNNRQSGGGSVKGRRLAQRRLRGMGVRYYLGRGGDWGNGYNVWGILPRWEEFVAREGEMVVTGVSIGHCAHKLGEGDARNGWDFVWS